ncbi:MAG: glycosyltransferase family 39 protein [Bacteroidota bacterium]|nr:glycosyltransferase family 39 protein [Bacteroidota bacterium]
MSIENRIRIFIILIALLLFLPFNGLVHLFDWDEINFAESAREMITTGDYSTVRINFIPFWEKPPFFIWMQVISMQLFGINEFAARFPNAICGVLSLLVLFEIGTGLKNYKFGLAWTMAYGASILPFLYFKSGIIDPWFNLFIFSAIYFAFKYLTQREANRKATINMILSAGILGLATLTKGPVAILLFGVPIFLFLLIERKFKLLKWVDILLFSLVLFFTGGAYHLYQIFSGNWKLVVDFIDYQLKLMKTEDAGHGGSIFYHPLVLFVGMFPTSILAFRAFFNKSIENNDYRKLMIVLFCVVLVIFSLIKTKIVHYSSLCYFPLSYLAAVSIYDIYINKATLSKLGKTFILVVGSIWAITPGIVQLVATRIPADVLKKYIKDDFAIACIDTAVHWSGFEFLIGLAFGIGLIVAVFYLKGTKQILAIYGSTALFVFLFMLLLVPKIEKYSQGPAIGFISAFEGKPVWISTLGYKSYAPYFYSGKTSRACPEGDEEEFLLHGKTGREVYFVAKITGVQEFMDKNPQLVIIEKKGGFVLIKRVVIQ